MTALAPILEAFFTDHLMTQRQASTHTVAAFRDTFRLLLTFAHQRLGKTPALLDMTDLDVPLICGFLQNEATPRPPATPAWPRSTPYSPTPPCGCPNTPG